MSRQSGMRKKREDAKYFAAKDDEIQYGYKMAMDGN